MRVNDRQTGRRTTRRDLVVGQRRMQSIAELKRADRGDCGQEHAGDRQLGTEEVEVVPNVVSGDDQAANTVEDVAEDLLEGRCARDILLRYPVDGSPRRPAEGSRG
jgi:hypothetical protein